MTLKRRFNILFNKIDNYIKDTPNRLERNFQRKMLREERRLERLQLQTDIELEKSEIEKQRLLREAARLKLRKERDKLREVPMPFSMYQEQKKLSTR